MQDANCPAHVQALSQPARHCGPCVQAEPVSLMPRAERVHGIAGYFGRSRDFRQDPTVRAAESTLAAGQSIEPIALLVDGAMVPATEQRKIRERGGASIGP